MAEPFATDGPSSGAGRCVVAPVPCFGGERRSYRGICQPFPAHCHEHFVIGLVSQGRRQLVCNDRLFDLGPGSLFAFAPGDVHSCRQQGESPFAFESVTVTPEVAGPVRFAVPCTDDPQAVALFNEMLGALEAGDNGSALHLLSDLLMSPAQGTSPAENNIEALSSQLSAKPRRASEPHEAHGPACPGGSAKEKAAADNLPAGGVRNRNARAEERASMPVMHDSEQSAPASSLREWTEAFALPSLPNAGGFGQTPGATSPSDASAQRLFLRFRENPAASVRLDRTAAHEELSTSALIRAYRRRFHITPMQHLASMRVEQACRLLADGLPTAEVAACCGFADQAHLTREFKRRLGITPGRYRRQAGADARTTPHAPAQRSGSQGRDAEGGR